jgi:parvulin-like peptidyl-prolyl isomerase
MTKRGEGTPSIKRAEVRRRHRSRAERERRINRIVLIAAGALVVAIVALLVFGVAYEAVVKPNEPVATVGDVSISTRDFQSRFKLQRYQTIIQLANLAPIYGTCDTADAQSPIYQFCQQLQYPSLMGLAVLDAIIEEEVIRQEAEARGIVVSDEEVQDQINEFFRYNPNPQTPTPSPEPLPTATRRFTPTPTLTRTPTLTPTGTLAPPPSPTPSLMPSEMPTATATLTSEEARLRFEDNFNGEAALVAALAGIGEQEYRAIYKAQLVREKVSEAITADVATIVDQVRLRQIRVSTEQEAFEILEALRDGESFAALARNADAPRDANDPNRYLGGDLDWQPRESLGVNVAAEAFEAPIGPVVGPIRDVDILGAQAGQLPQEYYFIIQVLGHQVRPLDEAMLESQREERFDTWLSSGRSQAETFDYWRERVPEHPTEAEIWDEVEKLASEE